jgi:beta-lactamase superfamily II metal-dependent hydrolase
MLLASDGEIMVIDTGAGATLLEYLLSSGYRTIGRVLVSHADRDHVGGLIGLLGSKAFGVNEVCLNSDAFKGSRSWRDLIYELDALDQSSHIQVQLGVRQGNRYSAGRLNIDILAPRARLVGLGAGGRDSAGRRIESNSLSLVAKVLFEGAPVALVPGDLDELGLDHLLDQDPGPDLAAPVLVFPHHGGHVARSADNQANRDFAVRLTDLVKPTTVVFSVGRGHHDNPRPEIISAIRGVIPNIRIICTQLSRRCAAEAPAGAYTGTHLTPIVARGRETRACCGGSVVINLGDGGSGIHPTLQLHREFIENWAPTALCR